MNNWKVYILECSDNSLYTGITNNLPKRIKTHNEKKGAKYTRARTPVNLVYSEGDFSRSEASKREYQIKKLSRENKLKMIQEKTNNSYQSKT